MWRLSGPGIERNAVLRLDDRRLAVQEGRCVGSGGWVARPTGELLVYLNGTCSGRGCVHAPTLATAVAFRVDGRQRELLDPDRRVVATLRPAAG